MKDWISCAGGLALCLGVSTACAQPYPSNPVRMSQGVSPTGTSPEEFAAMIQKEMVMLGKVVKAANVKVD